jgi:hypothetical protein
MAKNNKDKKMKDAVDRSFGLSHLIPLYSIYHKSGGQSKKHFCEEVLLVSTY